MNSLLAQYRPLPGWEAFYIPAYLRFFGGPGVAPHALRDHRVNQRRRQEQERRGIVEPSDPHQDRVALQFTAEYLLMVAQMAGASLPQIYASRERGGGLGSLRRELEEMGLTRDEAAEERIRRSEGERRGGSRGEVMSGHIQHGSRPHGGAGPRHPGIGGPGASESGGAGRGHASIGPGAPRRSGHGGGPSYGAGGMSRRGEHGRGFGGGQGHGYGMGGHPEDDFGDFDDGSESGYDSY